MCQHSFASDLSFHPHWHLIVSDGVFAPDGDFYHLWNWDSEAILDDLRSSKVQRYEVFRVHLQAFARFEVGEKLTLEQFSSERPSRYGDLMFL
jgi:Putative transposase